MATRNRFLIGMLALLVIAFVLWIKRNVEIEIAGVRFSFPAKAVFSSSKSGSVLGLDQNSGAFVVLPEGPYYGSWSLLLQSSKDRAGDGMPSGFKDALGKGEITLSKTSFGWLACDARCGRDEWLFQQVPNPTDSTYSVGTVICFDTEICKLFLSYGDVDVQVSMQRERVNEVPQVLNGVIAVLGKHDLTRAYPRREK